MRLRILLPVFGFILFACVSYYSLRINHGFHSNRYFWWSTIRLDSDPLNKGSGAITSIIWVDPGLFGKVLMISAFPAFVLGIAAVAIFGRLGIDEITSFMILTPILISAWYYFIGWLIDRWIQKRFSRMSNQTV